MFLKSWRLGRLLGFPVEINVSFLLLLALVFIGFGGLAGALAARRRGFDIVGVLFLAVIGGLGGALLRDLLLQVPVRALTSHWLLPSAFLGGLLVAPLLEGLRDLLRRELLELAVVAQEAPHAVSGGPASAPGPR